jgi:hypothetical protein
MLIARWAHSEGLLLLSNGVVARQEAIFSAPTGVEAGNSAAYTILNNENLCTLIQYPMRFESPSAELTVQRLAAGDCVRDIIGRYRDIVGKGLAVALANDINNQVRQQGLYFQLIADVLVDTNVFRTRENAKTAYHTLFDAIRFHMEKVIGSTLAASEFSAALRRMRPEAAPNLQAGTGSPPGIMFDGYWV